MKAANAPPRFYREVLSPVDIEVVKTAILESREHRARLTGSDSAPNLKRFPFAGRIGNLREFTASALMTAMTNALAAIVVEELLWNREDHVLQQETVADYTKKSKNLLRHYRETLQLEHDGDLSPVVAGECLFEQSRSVDSAAWKQYRSALLYAFRKTRGDLIRRSKEYAAYNRAIAILAVVNQPPHPDERAKTRTAERKMGISSSDCEAVFARLASSNVNRSHVASIFTRVTLATGVRPREWNDAQYIEADPHDETSLPMLCVLTAKSKQGAEDEYRTLVLITPEVQKLVRQQLFNVQAENDAASPGVKATPLDNFVKKCSARLIDECKLIWPNNQKRRYTLYTLRQQASANFKDLLDEDYAAEIMGHSVEVSRRNYASKTRAHKGLTLAVAPGPDVIERVEKMRAKAAIAGNDFKHWKDTHQSQSSASDDLGDESGADRHGSSERPEGS